MENVTEKAANISGGFSPVKILGKLHPLTSQCTRIATARFYDGYLLAKKWVIEATIASPQSRNFKRWADCGGKIGVSRWASWINIFLAGFQTRSDKTCEADKRAAK